MYGTGEAEADQLVEMAREACKPNWWNKYEDLSMPSIGLEQDAASITSYMMYYLPALLQTKLLDAGV